MNKNTRVDGSAVTSGRPRALALAVAVGAGFSATAALSQELEEVVVTAERRATELQDTPLSIIALTGETLEAKGVEDLMDLADFTPNLSIKPGRTGGSNAPVFSIRGIGGGGGATGERGVALYVDGIYVPRTSGSIFKVFDIDRAEVLRGPQGTLFGRNSEGGAIRLFTKQPTDDFDAYLRATVGNFDQMDISGMVNIPLTEKLAVRAQAAYLSQDGYVNRATQDLGSSTDRLARVQVAYDFTESVKLTLGGFYNDSRGDGSPQDIISFDLQPNLNYQGNNADWLRDAYVLAGQAPLAVLDDYTMPALCFIDDFNPDWDEACALYDNNKYYQFDANLQWAINENLQFASITGYSRLDHDSLSDGPLLGFNVQQDNVQSESVYQEFQLNLTLFGGKVDAVTGLSYFHEDSSSSGVNYQRRGTSTYPTAAQAAAGGVGAANGNTGEAFVRTTYNANVDQVGKSYGWFNSLTWHITDKLNLTGGVRFAYDEKEIQSERVPGNPVDFVPVPGTTSTTVHADDDWNSTDWRATLDYHFTEDTMAYATASKAHKAGAYPGFTFISCTTPASPGSATCPTGEQQSALYQSIPPESVINYEAGLRATFFDNRLRINPTGYFMAWTDRQTAVRQACVVSADCPTGSNVFLRSTGDIDLYGFELDAQFAVTDSLMLDAAYGSTHFDIKDPVANGGPNLFPPQASPTFNVGATYTLRETNIGGFTFNVNYSYTAEQQTYPESTDPAALSDGSYELESYSVVNARVQWTSSNQKNQVILFANNLLDNDYATFASKFGGGFWDTFNPAVGQVPPGVGAPLRNMVSVTRARPLEYGITVQHNF